MSKSTDVIVAGSGLAGLMAAYAAAKSGARVKVVSEGMGCLAISAGCVDLLGYDMEGKRLADPWPAIAKLPAEHPYSLLGNEAIRTALNEFTDCMAAGGLKMRAAPIDAQPQNTLMPTIAGTLKPSWLIPADIEADALQKAQKILIVSVKGFRDCRPALIASQLSRYPELKGKDFDTTVLPAPFAEHGRSLNALDLAHMADRTRGRDWVVDHIKGLGAKYDLALVPPIFGARANSGIRKLAQETLGCPFIEMLSVPPGVAGLRIRDALVNTLVDMGAEFYENAQIVRAQVNGGKCEKVTLACTGREIELEAKSFVVATGGILSGGIILEQGKATEAIFGLDIPVPADVDEWSQPAVFGKHLVSSLGVSVDANLQARGAGLGNVFFAGRVIGGYDQATEKSGHGVAIATGWHAGQKAAGLASGGNI